MSIGIADTYTSSVKSDDDAVALIHHALKLGITLLDTADIYGNSERQVGKALAGKRDKVVLATKVGMEMGPDKKGLSKPYIFKAVEASLKRLQTDRIDLYQSHKDDPDTPLEETLEAFNTLIRQGKVRAIGASNYSAARLAESLKISKDEDHPRYQCHQPEYNLMERAGYEDELEPLCEQHGIAVIPYYSLASGFLSGKYRAEGDLKKSARGQAVKKYLNARGFRVLDALEAIAAETASTPARVAVAWLKARPSITAPIASATSIEQLDDLIEAARLELDDAAIKRLNEASG
jgi:aryl-alcohol dehydrogenase-like predicted oxidoreductase